MVIIDKQEENNVFGNTPVSSYDRVTSLCRCSSFIEAGMVFVYVNGGTDAALDAK